MKQRGIIVGININNVENFEESMIELENLCEACNIDVVGEVVQNSNKVNPTAGKSSIMNALVDRFMKKDDKRVFEKDMLFGNT